MLGKFAIGLFLTAALLGCSQEPYAAEKKLVASTLAEGVPMPKVEAAPLYDGVLLVGQREYWYVSEGRVTAANPAALESSPSISWAPASIIETIREVDEPGELLLVLQERPPTLPAHLGIRHHDLFDRVRGSLANTPVHIDGRNAPGLVSFGRPDEHFPNRGHFPAGRYELEETAGWITRISLVLEYATGPDPVQDNETADALISSLCRAVTDVPENEDCNEMNGRLEPSGSEVITDRAGLRFRAWLETGDEDGEPGETAFYRLEITRPSSGL